MPNVGKRVRQILHTKMGVTEERITSHAHLKKDPGLDSLDAVELIIELEKEFDVALPNEEVEGFNTLHDIISCIGQKISKNDL